MSLVDADPRIQAAKKLKANFVLFARHCLRIRTKDSRPAEPLELNEAQLYIHKRIEDQLARTGRVRALILKGRQQGASTYVEGRFYWRTATSLGVKTLIIAHEQIASDNLFEMANRYHDNMPRELRPSTQLANAKELRFGKLDGGYRVMTAGSKAVGRSQTATLLHASEFAFWDNAAEHMAGIGQAVPDLPGTEIIIESTAKGLGNEFQIKVSNARAGIGDYELIFIPWFWTAEYRRQVPADFVPTEQEVELQALYGLDLEQVAWRRNKIETEFSGDEVKFFEEYPNNPDEAFQAEKRETFIPMGKVMAARRCLLSEPATGPLILGVDVARFGPDRTAICWRRGREVKKLKTWKGLSTMQTAGIVAKIIITEKPAKVFIDVIGIGAGVVDRLIELGYVEIVEGVNASSSPSNEVTYRNKRVEMWGDMRDWLNDAPCSIPDSDALQMDLLQPGFKYDSAGRYVLESKDDIAKRQGPSPDLADALALTFAEPVMPFTPEAQGQGNMPASRIGGY